MATAMSRFQNGPERKRKAHAKSRKGCGNCKLRRVKCDEARPQCRKCASYRVACNYDGVTASLHLAAQGAFEIELAQKPSRENMTDSNMTPWMPCVSLNATMAGMIQASLREAVEAMDTGSTAGVGPSQLPAFWKFSEPDLDTLKRFQERTAMTIGTTKTTPTFRDAIARMALSHPFLMHMILSLTLMHDAHLASSNSAELAAKSTHASLQHWNMATKLFNRTLSRPVPPSHRDAIWATGTLLGAAVFSFVESTNAEEAWPLKPSDPNDLDWLKLSDGKKALWRLANPMRPDSVFRVLAQDLHYHTVPRWVRENDISTIPAHLCRLLNITRASTARNNVYHLPALILSQLPDAVPGHDNMLMFLYFMGYMTPEFRELLVAKDPRAVLLLGMWLEKMEHAGLWWIKRRANVEARSIRMWLERRYGGEEGLSRMIFEQTGFDKAGSGSVSRDVDLEARLPCMDWDRSTQHEMQEEMCPTQ